MGSTTSFSGSRCGQAPQKQASRPLRSRPELVTVVITDQTLEGITVGRPLNEPVDLHGRRSGIHAAEISGKLYKMADEVRVNLAGQADMDYVIKLGITLLHSAMGKTITLTDPSTGEEEDFQLWQT